LHWFLYHHPQGHIVPGKCGMCIIQKVYTLLRHSVPSRASRDKMM
jgi:hypothetical protein